MIRSSLSICLSLHAQPVKPSKTAVKEAKVLEKAGWRTCGKMSVAEQVELGLQMQETFMELKRGIFVTRYLMVSAEATAQSLELATTLGTAPPVKPSWSSRPPKEPSPHRLNISGHLVRCRR